MIANNKVVWVCTKKDDEGNEEACVLFFALMNGCRWSLKRTLKEVVKQDLYVSATSNEFIRHNNVVQSIVTNLT